MATRRPASSTTTPRITSGPDRFSYRPGSSQQPGRRLFVRWSSPALVPGWRTTAHARPAVRPTETIAASGEFHLFQNHGFQDLPSKDRGGIIRRRSRYESNGGRNQSSRHGGQGLTRRGPSSERPWGPSPRRFNCRRKRFRPCARRPRRVASVRREPLRSRAVGQAFEMAKNQGRAQPIGQPVDLVMQERPVHGIFCRRVFFAAVLGSLQINRPPPGGTGLWLCLRPGEQHRRASLPTTRAGELSRPVWPRTRKTAW